jgi:glutamine amidotransferase
MNKKVAIVDYGMGNLHSLFRVFTRLQIQAIISCDPKEISEASHVVLPGVGHFGRAMDELKKRDLLSVINDVSLDYRKPMLGICLGMQLMTQGSEEGDCAGLGW